jgi:hypothetical protein
MTASDATAARRSARKPRPPRDATTIPGARCRLDRRPPFATATSHRIRIARRDRIDAPGRDRDRAVSRLERDGASLASDVTGNTPRPVRGDALGNRPRAHPRSAAPPAGDNGRHATRARRRSGEDHAATVPRELAIARCGPAPSCPARRLPSSAQCRSRPAGPA